MKIKISSVVAIKACFIASFVSGIAPFLLPAHNAVEITISALFALIGVFYACALEKEVKEAVKVCVAIDKGDFEARIVLSKANGVMKELHRAINRMIDRNDAFVRESRACLQYVAENKYFRKVLTNGMSGSFKNGAVTINNATEAMDTKISLFKKVADNFESKINAVVEMVSAAATELQASSKSMEDTASNTSDLAVNVASAAEEAATNVQTVASAAEELSSSISNIKFQVSNSASETDKAMVQMNDTNKQIGGLVNSINKISEVMDFINDIASQTNLLALNATIEAARAGAAGKGFAVVANEVKNLSQQTSKATEDITKLVSEIQSATNLSVSSIELITNSMSSVHDATKGVEGSVEEQAAATEEISHSVQQASIGTSEVTNNIGMVMKASVETKEIAQEVLAAAGELSLQAETLKGEVDKFIVEMKKAV